VPHETREYLTPPEIAKRLRVNVDKVLTWIRSGELRAINVATRRGCRPRYRVAVVDLESFLRSRAVVPPQPVTRRRSKPANDVIEFY
jgi:excisionase family DNA binding protein